MKKSDYILFILLLSVITGAIAYFSYYGLLPLTNLIVLKEKFNLYAYFFLAVMYSVALFCLCACSLQIYKYLLKILKTRDGVSIN